MTGFGDARGQNDRLSMSVEVRAVNNRYFKLVTKTPERYQALEGNIERVVRESISRGTVNVSVRVENVAGSMTYRLDAAVLKGYWQQLTLLTSSLGVQPPDNLGSLLGLPGVVVDGDASTGDPREDWPLIESSLREALSKLGEFRTVEGASMEKDLQLNLRTIATELEKISTCARKSSMSSAINCSSAWASCCATARPPSNRPTSSVKSAFMPSGATSPRKSSACARTWTSSRRSSASRSRPAASSIF